MNRVPISVIVRINIGFHMMVNWSSSMAAMTSCMMSIGHINYSQMQHLDQNQRYDRNKSLKSLH